MRVWLVLAALPLLVSANRRPKESLVPGANNNNKACVCKQTLSQLCPWAVLSPQKMCECENTSALACYLERNKECRFPVAKDCSGLSSIPPVSNGIEHPKDYSPKPPTKVQPGPAKGGGAGKAPKKSPGNQANKKPTSSGAQPQQPAGCIPGAYSVKPAQKVAAAAVQKQGKAPADAAGDLNEPVRLPDTRFWGGNGAVDTDGSPDGSIGMVEEVYVIDEAGNINLVDENDAVVTAMAS